MRLERPTQQREVFHRKATDISIAQKMYTLIYQYARESPNDGFCAQHGRKDKRKRPACSAHDDLVYKIWTV